MVFPCAIAFRRRSDDLEYDRVCRPKPQRSATRNPPVPIATFIQKYGAIACGKDNEMAYDMWAGHKVSRQVHGVARLQGMQLLHFVTFAYLYWSEAPQFRIPPHLLHFTFPLSPAPRSRLLSSTGRAHTLNMPNGLRTHISGPCFCTACALQAHCSETPHATSV